MGKAAVSFPTRGESQQKKACMQLTKGMKSSPLEDKLSSREQESEELSTTKTDTASCVYIFIHIYTHIYGTIIIQGKGY